MQTTDYIMTDKQPDLTETYDEAEQSDPERTEDMVTTNMQTGRAELGTS
jgi:hypothetical protein